MRVYEVAKDLGVPSEAVIQLLRELGVAVTSHMSSVSESDAAKVVAKVERERRSGHESAEEAIEAAIEESRSSTGRRRRRRRAPEPEPEAEEEAGEEAEAEEAAGGEAEAEPAAEVEETAEAAAGEPEAGEEAPDEEEPVAEAEPSGEEDEAGEAIEAAVEEAAAEEAEEPEEAEADEADEVEETVAEAGEAEEEEAGEAPEAEDVEEAEEPAEVEAGAEVEAEAEAVAAEAAEAEEGGEEEASPEGKRSPRPARTLRVPRPAASAGPGGKVRIEAEGYTKDGRSKSKKSRKGKKKRKRPDEDTVQENIQRVMAEIKSGGKKKRRSRSKRPSKEEVEAQEEKEREERKREATTVRVNEFLTVAELAELIDASATEIIGSAFKNLGLMVTMNQRLDYDQIELLLDEFGYTAVREEEYGTEAEEDELEEAPEDLEPRPPVVTVMGHVDHGKTLLLDYIRETNVVAGEEGGITQHIGAYHVEVEDDRSLTFLDTPGHAAFTAMRARGADVTDIVILVVAGDDSIMPQTVEAISHAKNAGVPLVVAINKCDLPQADPMRVKQELLNHQVTVEEFGGDVLAAEVSAKTGDGVDDLLEKILLQAELLELKANPERNAEGTVIEAQLDPGKGAVTTVLVQNGRLEVGDSFICGLYDGRVRAMFDERGQNVEVAGPGIPVQVLGASGVPQAGDSFQAMEADRAGEIAQNRQRLDREKQLRVKGTGVKLGELSELLAEGETVTLPLIIKGDVDGSVQAVSDSLEQLGTEEVQVEVIHRGVGAINESDVLLATTSGAVIIGFRVRPDTNARQLAEREDVDIHTYDIIYEAIDEIRAALEGMLAPEERERVLGSAEVRETFRISKVGTVAGCYVEDGKVDRNARVRVVRDGVVAYDGRIASLKRFQDDVREVREGFECGIGVENFNDVKVGDILECYVVEEVARTLAGAGEAAG